MLYSLDSRGRKAGTISPRADPAVQAESLGRRLEPRSMQAGRGRRAVSYLDAAHFVSGSVSGFCGVRSASENACVDVQVVHLIDAVYQDVGHLFHGGDIIAADFREFRHRLWDAREACCDALLE